MGQFFIKGPDSNDESVDFDFASEETCAVMVNLELVDPALTLLDQATGLEILFSSMSREASPGQAYNARVDVFLEDEAANTV